MGRLEKQIIAGALALVGFLLILVVYRGIDPGADPSPTAAAPPVSRWQDPAEPATRHDLAPTPVEKPTVAAGAAAEPAPAGAAALPLAITGPDRSEPEPAEEEVETASPPALPEPAPATEPAPVVHDLAPGQDWDPGLRTYTVRPGDTLGHIAQRELGSIRYVDEILKLNEGVVPERLRPGQVLTLPTHVRRRRQAAAAAPPPGVRTHVVATGDSLWSIAARYYGDGSQYERILAANPGLSKDSVLRIGDRIVVPE
ncbi:MAG: LysM domain-containing protein [Planctomycetota bacterium]|nr:MAG: LysM domain-containing protein [Planctomycetota bacterium]